MFEPDKITRNGAPSNGSAQKDTPLREASRPLMLQGKMWVIASPSRERPTPPRAQGEPQRVRARSSSPALAVGPKREGAPRGIGRRRARRLREGRRPLREGSGPTGAGGYHARLRQGRGVGQRAPGAALVP